MILNWTSRWWPQWIDMGKGSVCGGIIIIIHDSSPKDRTSFENKPLKFLEELDLPLTQDADSS